MLTTVAIVLLVLCLLGMVSSTAIGGLIPGYIHAPAAAPAPVFAAARNPQLEEWKWLFAHGTTRR